ncbi:hypothetical protein Afil01_01660 [Actinorhabdospora filicis]|uniref:Uncharacterized protein n=1 Tax=Actinorhabdospora filicis TaxID=1785913 RepID=A0A9W6SDQ9_9ACTN|nr:hypothetical protein [Actinorhabdospora filicis]GLZ75359.1 hypothetical protein Afil01_01660 [Actinorhabdospora filicis]
MGLGDRLRRLDGRVLPPLGSAARRLRAGAGRRRVIASTGMVGAAILIVLAVIWTAGRGARPVDDSGSVVRVGVEQGADIPSYVDASGRELTELAKVSPAPTWALVSLSAYASPAQAAATAVGVEVARVYARVPLPRTQTEIIAMDIAALPGGLDAEMERAAVRKDADAASYGALAVKLSGTSAEEADQRAVYEGARAMAAAEAAAYRAHCACAYALVVRAAPAELLELAKRPFVRAVDPAPELTRFERSVFLPPLPEQEGAAGPADGALSAPSPPVGTPPAR